MSIVVSGRLLCDLELLINGAFKPLDGFLKEKDYNSVVNNCRLSNGKVWPMPIVFPINELDSDKYKVGCIVLLKDPTGLTLAKLYIEEKYKPDLNLECEKVLGSTDPNHPYYKEIRKNYSVLYIGGKVEKVNLPFHFDFRQIRRTPDEVKKEIASLGLKRVVGFQTRNPMHKCHYELVKYAMNQIGDYTKEKDIGCLIHPVVGVTQDCDIDYGLRVRCYQKIMNHLPKTQSLLSLLPLSLRMAGPREALFHALIRKNYGCTHFIVGRDHAGPSYKKQNGESFYGPYEAHELLAKYEDEIGIKVIVSKIITYVKELGEYRAIDKVENGHTTQHISGTEQRKLLVEGKDIPEWFSFPEVVSELKQIYRPNYEKGFCIYFVGLSGSGKSVLASFLNDKLRELLPTRPVTILDGDIVRKNLSSGLGFSKKDRSTNVKRIGYVASEVIKHRGICICSNIAPYKQDRLDNKQLIEKYGGYFEIFVNTPLEKCEERDCKGLYKLARAGTIKEFTGISDPFEEPLNADLTLTNSSISDIEKNISTIIEKLVKTNYIKNNNL